MALDQSALLELLGELKLTDVTDRIRSATETLYQELTTRKLPRSSALPRSNGPRTAPLIATGLVCVR